MCVIAANDTGKAAATHAARLRPTRVPMRGGFVEDLNWPVPATPGRKPARPVEVWAPGPDGGWEGEVPRMQ